MAIAGLRPLKETNQLGSAPTHYANMSGAYDIYVQDQYTAEGDPNIIYYAAKWLKLAAGTYTIRAICDDTGSFFVDHQKVADGGPVNGAFLEPVVTQFVIARDDTYRWDIQYHNSSVESPAYAAYELRRGSELIEVSRAQDFVGDIRPIPDSALGPKPPYDDDIRLTYPIFLPKPDWKTGVLERLEWLTDVLTSESGAEQRRKLRQYPRRNIEASFLAHGYDRSLLEAYLTGVGQGYGLVPLWWDQTGVDPAAAGSVDIFCDTQYREFFLNDVVIIRRPGDIWSYELNVITGKTTAQLTLKYGLQSDLPRGSSVTPVRVARILEQMAGSGLTDEVKQFQLRFYTLEAAEYTKGWTLPIYTRTNLPIVTWTPDYQQQIALSYDRNSYQWDNSVGNVYAVDPGNTATVLQKQTYMLQGRAEMHTFKSNLYQMAGRYKEFHQPSGANEFDLSRDPNEADGALIVLRSGYSQYNNEQQPVRRDILIEMYDGRKLPNTIISTRVIDSEEWLYLSETFPSVPKEQVRRISYMPRSRLDIDAIEINRVTDADGVNQVTLTTKAFTSRRNAPPIPIQ